MSTKAIRKALEMMRLDPSSQEFADRPEYRAAMAEVEAIEKTAKFMVSVDTLESLDANGIRAAAEANDVIESIARNAP